MKLQRLFFPAMMAISLVSCDFSIKNITGIGVQIEEKSRVQGDSFDIDDLTAILYYDNSESKEVSFSKFDAYELTAVAYYPNGGNSGILYGDFPLNFVGNYEIEVSYNPVSKFKYGCNAKNYFSVERLYVPVTSLSLDSTSLSISKDAQQQIEYTIKPDNATYQNPTFSSNDTNVATVDSDGVVTGIEEGQCVVTVSVDGISKECLVTVTPSSTQDYVFTSANFESSNGNWTSTEAGSSFDSRNNRGVAISTETKITSPVELTDITNIEFECASGGSQSYFFSGSCGSIETYVGDTRIGGGTLGQPSTSYKANYDVESLSGYISLVIKPNESNNIKIYIRSISITANSETIYPTSISLSGANTIGIGESDKLTISYTPVTANKRNITWSSSNEDVLTVGIDGTIHGIKQGSAVVTAIAENPNGNCSSNFTVNVIKIPVDSIELNSSSFDIYEGRTKTITPTVLPNNASNKEVTYSSSNSNVATVDASGNITGVGIGTCTITCTSKDNPTVTSSCTVTVSEQPALSSKPMSYVASDYIHHHFYTLSSTPSVGNAKLLVIPVWLTDSSSYISNRENVRSDIQKAYFGTESDTGWQSVKTFYETESNGKLTLDGCVSEWYECGKSLQDLNYSSSSGNNTTPNLVKSAVNWYFTNHTSDSRSNYDCDNDGYLDGVILIYGCPDYSSLSSSNWRQNYGDNLWAYTYWLQSSSLKSTASPGPNAFFWASYDFMYSSGTYAQKRTGKTTYGSGNTSYQSIDTHTFIHEMGHLFGLEDYYDYSSYYKPAGGFSMQDYNVGGHDPFSCLSLGWAEAYIPIDDCEIELKPFQSEHSVILLSPSWNEKNSPFDEYLLIELYTPTGLNEFDTNHRYNMSTPQGVNATGIRLWHVDGRLVKYSSSGMASASNIYTYPVDNNDFAMSNTYYSSSTSSYISPLGKSYANYNILQFIRNDKTAKYNPNDDFKSATLFKDGSSFTMNDYKGQFVNSGKLNSGIDLGWEFSVSLKGTDGSAVATISVRKN